MTPRYYWLGLLTVISLFALSSVQAEPLHKAAGSGNIDQATKLIAKALTTWSGLRDAVLRPPVSQGDWLA